MRVVLDTNTLVSALVFHRERWTWLREAWMTGRIVPLVGTETARELIRVLAYPKFKLSADEQRALREDIVPYCETVAQLPEDDLVPCRDPHDQIFLRLAQVGEVPFLVTGDEDFLSYEGRVSFAIVSPAEFRARIGE